MQSNGAYEEFYVLPAAAGVTIDPPNGTYGPINVTLYSAPPSAIYYTTDGSDPVPVIR